MRISPFLPKLTLENQAAFLRGRSITDHILICHEALHSFKKKKQKSGYLMVKTDLSKAFDQVKWSFLLKALLSFGLHPKVISLIQGCITTTSFSIVINGRPTTPFSPGKGLRQGDPLSPTLFILCMEILSRAMTHLSSTNQIQPYFIARFAPPLSHLFFADDCLFFFKANIPSCVNFSKLLKLFSQESGQIVNYNKSCFIPSQNIPPRHLGLLQRFLKINLSNNLGKYLGVSHSDGHSSKPIFFHFLEKISKMCYQLA